MSRTKWERLMTGLAVLVFLFILSNASAGSQDGVPTQERSQPISASTSTNAFVVRVVDGDTLSALQDGETEAVTIRLLGVNTPETVDPRRPVECFGKEASNYTKAQADQKRVRLEPDPQADEVDKYGRLLRNVFLENGSDLNADLVRDGYAYAYLSFPLNTIRKAELARLQEEAKLAERGLWNPETCANTYP